MWLCSIGMAIHYGGCMYEVYYSVRVSTRIAVDFSNREAELVYGNMQPIKVKKQTTFSFPFLSYPILSFCLDLK